MLTFMVRNERYTYYGNGDMRLQDLSGGENHGWRNGMKGLRVMHIPSES